MLLGKERERRKEKRASAQQSDAVLGAWQSDQKFHNYLDFSLQNIVEYGPGGRDTLNDRTNAATGHLVVQHGYDFAFKVCSVRTRLIFSIVGLHAVTYKNMMQKFPSLTVVHFAKSWYDICCSFALLWLCAETIQEVSALRQCACVCASVSLCVFLGKDEIGIIALMQSLAPSLP